MKPVLLDVRYLTETKASDVYTQKNSVYFCIEENMLINHAKRKCVARKQV